MNVKAITEPSEIAGGSGASNGTQNASGSGDFSTALRGAVGEEGSTESAGADSDTSREPGEGSSSGNTEADTSSEQRSAGNEGEGANGARPNSEADERNESTAEEQAAEAAQAAADTGALGELLAGRQTASREGAGLSAVEESQGASSALDPNGGQAGGNLPGEEDALLDGQSRGIDSVADANALGNAQESAEVGAEQVDASEASQVAEVGTDSLNRGIEGEERAAEVAVASPTSAEGAASRDGDARADLGAGGDGASQGDREGSNNSRDFAEEQAAADERASLADQETQQGVAAEAAAAYAAASGNVRADEAVPVDGGIAVAGAAAVTAPETASAPTAPTANAPQPAAASDAIAVQTEWLATRGGGSARLRLSPAELGEIEIRVTVRGGAVEVVIVAQEAVTQAIAEEQSDRLTQAFAQRDLRMDAFDVRRGDPNAASNQGNGDFAQSSQQGEDRNGQDHQAGDGRESAAAGQAGGAAAPSAPVMPQILTTGPEASVDLRI